jgi:hypothetical protein
MLWCCGEEEEVVEGTEADSREERRGERLAVWVDMTGREEGETERDIWLRLEGSAVVCCREVWAVVVAVLLLQRLGDVGGVISWMTGGLDERLWLVQGHVEEEEAVVAVDVKDGKDNDVANEEEQQLEREAGNRESIPGKGAIPSTLLFSDDDDMAEVTRYVPVVGESWARNVPHLTSSTPPLLLLPEIERLPILPLPAKLLPVAGCVGILSFSSGLDGGVTVLRAECGPAPACRRASNSTDEEVTPSQLARPAIRPPAGIPRLSLFIVIPVETDLLRLETFFGSWNV